MSFGFSVGDFLTAGKLIADIVSSLRTCGGSAAEYQELMSELHSLEQALLNVERFLATEPPSLAMNTLKKAVLVCQYPLQEFYAKVSQFDASLGMGQSSGKVKDISRKLQWGWTKKEDVQKLRMYLSAHVETINMMLVTFGL